MVTYEEAEMAFRKSGKEYSTGDVLTCVERDILPTETPLQAASRKAADREAEKRRQYADSAEMTSKALTRAKFKKEFPAVFE
jgi:hypothetical protein